MNDLSLETLLALYEKACVTYTIQDGRITETRIESKDVL